MVVAKRQKKENGTKENLRTRVRTSGETKSPPGYPNLCRAGSGGGERKHIKRGTKIEPFSSFVSACTHAWRMYFPLVAK